VVHKTYYYCLSRHRIEIEEIIDCASKELNLEMQLNSIEEEWTEQVRTKLHIVKGWDEAL